MESKTVRVQRSGIDTIVYPGPDPGYQWESDKLTVIRHKREPRGQPFPSRLPQGTNKQTPLAALSVSCLQPNSCC